MRWSWTPKPAPERPGLGWLVGLAVAAGLAWAGRPVSAGVVAATAAGIGLAGALWPAPTARALRAVGAFAGRWIGRAALTVVFYAVVTPLGLIRGRHALDRAFPGEGSAWRRREPPAADARRRWS